MMASLRCCSYNCRGFNSGLVYLKQYINSFDLCFIQEHWLLEENLHTVCDSFPDFLSVGVSGMDSTSLICGRPYGGCSILFRKSLSFYITPLISTSNRFCAIRICDSSGLSLLLICVYMPALSVSSYYSEYLQTLGELEGFIESHQCDLNMLVGDFNVDFDRGGPLAKLLLDFMCELNLTATDLSYRNSINFTFERGDGLARSWIDHVICSQTSPLLVSDVRAVHSACNLSDHSPLCFQLNFRCAPAPIMSSSPSSDTRHIIWSKITPSHIICYQARVAESLSDLPSDEN